jgi:hypothetical protein
MSESILDKDKLNSIYADLQVRMEMGLLCDSENMLQAESFVIHLKDAIQEKVSSTSDDETVELDPFSVAFGMLSERFVNDNLQSNERWW